MGLFSLSLCGCCHLPHVAWQLTPQITIIVNKFNIIQIRLYCEFLIYIMKNFQCSLGFVIIRFHHMLTVFTVVIVYVFA